MEFFISMGKKKMVTRDASVCIVHEAKHEDNHIIQAEKEDFKVIILGDFNADPATYLDILTLSLKEIHQNCIFHLSIIEFSLIFY